jgi:hypothetical protein
MMTPCEFDLIVTLSTDAGVSQFCVDVRYDQLTVWDMLVDGHTVTVRLTGATNIGELEHWIHSRTSVRSVRRIKVEST